MAEYVYEVERSEHMGQGIDIRARKRERIVRCRDCEYAIMSYQDGLPRCAGPLVMEATLVSPDSFCSWGEPMEEES